MSDAEIDQEPLLAVEHLSVSFQTGRGKPVPALRDVSFTVRKCEVVAVVGESGCGKSTTALALLGLNPPEQAHVGGSVRLRRKTATTVDMVQMRESERKRVRGNDIAMIFQEPMSSLNPIYRIGTQIDEALRVHRPMNAAQRAEEALRLVSLLGIPSPAQCLKSYPHQLSGGMRQRVMIAIALSCQPSLLVADEPTTALDVTIQAQIVDQLRALQRDREMAIVFITHDLALVSDIADRVIVMYAGQIVEEGPASRIFAQPAMPYTQALMQSRPQLGVKDKPIRAIPGSAPNPAALPPGCSFHPRCRHRVDGLCDGRQPVLERVTDDHQVRCLRWREISEQRP
jgi:oligopeptide/dipeptide ABC transporter ATP-binding protein